MPQLKRRPVELCEDGTARQKMPSGDWLVVEAEDRWVLHVFSWSKDGRGYALAWKGNAFGGGFVKLHRLLCTSAAVVDHINGDKLDNRSSNLRPATKSQNGANQRRTRSRAGFKGVTSPADRSHHRKPYCATIVVAGVEKYLGWHETAEAAAAAYDEAARQYFGPYAATNEALGLLTAKQESTP